MLVRTQLLAQVPKLQPKLRRNPWACDAQNLISSPLTWNRFHCRRGAGGRRPDPAGRQAAELRPGRRDPPTGMHRAQSVPPCLRLSGVYSSQWAGASCLCKEFRTVLTGLPRLKEGRQVANLLLEYFRHRDWSDCLYLISEAEGRSVHCVRTWSVGHDSVRFIVYLETGFQPHPLFCSHSGFSPSQMLLRLIPGEIFGEISFLDAGDAGAATSVHAEGEVPSST